MAGKIVVYDDAGASTRELILRLREEFNGAAVVTAAGRDVAAGRGPGPDTALFVLPGIVGERSSFGRQLGAAGNRAIRDYVAQGGIFIGFCAGANYACREILYDPPWQPAPLRDRPGLDFFNGLARGPVPRPAPEKSFPVILKTVEYQDGNGNPRRAGIAYDYGPALYPAADELDDIEIIARYEDAPGKPVAVAAKKIGRGLAVFIGVLPFLKEEKVIPGPGREKLEALMRDLRLHEAERKDFWTALMARIRDHDRTTAKILEPSP